MGRPTCDIYLDEGEEYRWRLIGGNGEPLGGPQEGFTRKHDAERARRTAIKAAVEVAFHEYDLGAMVEEIRLEIHTERKHTDERKRQRKQ